MEELVKMAGVVVELVRLPTLKVSRQYLLTGQDFGWEIPQRPEPVSKPPVRGE